VTGMLTFRDFRRIALGMADAIERAHMGHPDFRVNGRIFATLHHDMKIGMVKVTPDRQAALMREHPAAFSPEAGAWGRSGCTRVRIDAVDEDTLGEALTFAWQAAMQLPPPRSSKPKAKTAAKSARRSKPVRARRR